MPNRRGDARGMCLKAAALDGMILTSRVMNHPKDAESQGRSHPGHTERLLAAERDTPGRSLIAH
jgi:hypothetical protein